MATTTKAAAPAKKSTGTVGVKNAIWILAVCCVIAYCIYFFVFGHPSHFVNGDNTGHPLPGDLIGTVYKGGPVVGLIITLLLSVIALTFERILAQRVSFGTMPLSKFTAQVKELIKAGKFDEAQALCNKMKGSVANVVSASIKAYKEVETNNTMKKAQKIAKIQQAHEEATQLEMPTLQMNLPIIATIVTLGTLTALFGTVLGMINSFQALSAGGGADSAALSAGISEALVNTASGILTSWVAVVSYNFLTNRIDKLTYALDEVGYTIATTYDVNHTEEA
ncbi:MAG: MotA/TolQ/ExbB proton channel family protein [Prevotella sp.]|nr:MotA/TolQ/ExbB proton channel family protein [Prevotella sp.]